MWSKDGNWIYALSNENIPNEVVKINVTSGEMKSIITLPVDEIDGVTMSPDGKHLVYASVEIQSDIWQMENFDPENELEQPIKIPDFPEYKQIAYLQKGAEYRRQQKYAEAEQVYREGLDLNPKNLELLDVLGMTLTNQKKYVEAEQIYRVGLVKDPTNQGFLDNLGITLLHQLKYDEAEKYFLEGLKQDPVDPTCMHGLITLNIDIKNYNAAQRYAEKWLGQSSPRNRNYRCLLLGRINMLQKNHALTEHYLEQSLAADSAYSAAYAGLGYLFHNQKQYDKAKNFALKAVSLDSSFVNQNLLAWTMVAGEIDTDGGIAMAEKAIASKPEDWAHTASIYPYYAIPEHTLGLAYLKKGDDEKAVQYLEQAAQLAPTRESIKNDLQLAKSRLSAISLNQDNSSR